jgi:drug/metabolite transporter (DMT)-like permease
VRAAIAAPIFAAIAAYSLGADVLSGVDGRSAAWLLVSALCSYAFADTVFFTAARRLGTPAALSIASTYPIWAALGGALVNREAFGPMRATATMLCVGGVIAVVQMGRAESTYDFSSPAIRRRDFRGLLLAGFTSLLWAGNSFSVKRGAGGLQVWQAGAIRYAFALAILLTSSALSRSRARPALSSLGWRRLMPAILADAVAGSAGYVYGLANTDLAVGATLTSLAPCLSVPVAILVGDERWSTARFLAITSTVVGVILLVLC